MMIETGVLVLMLIFRVVNGEGYLVYSWQPTLGFYSVFGPDFHAPLEVK